MHTVTIATTSQAAEIIEKAAAWIRRRVESGKRVRLTLADEKRTLSQNDHVQKIARIIAAQIGRDVSDDEDFRVFRRLLVAAWIKDTNKKRKYAISLDGEDMIDVTPGSSELDKPDCSEFLVWLIAESAGLGG